MHSKLSGQSVKLSDYKNVTDTLFAGKEKKKHYCRTLFLKIANDKKIILPKSLFNDQLRS